MEDAHFDKKIHLDFMFASIQRLPQKPIGFSVFVSVFHKNTDKINVFFSVFHKTITKHMSAPLLLNKSLSLNTEDICHPSDHRVHVYADARESGDVDVGTSVGA